ncbi:unnamed protein product [Paramecium sonneborni]|uniref:non-specific serine/threonine protein kinase n=1 Tax=Paramecium sonneborni TaxID=65129 RepID=A0A8S1RQJ9_9CILI|nr:unnamed protein product [Paramecium sonneborni]
MRSDTEQTQDSCQVCKKQDVELSRCSQCKSIYYCSIECQKKDWKDHKFICSEILLKQQREKQRAERKAQGKKAIEDFADFEVLGHGNFSDIFRVREIETNQLYALKQINKRKLTQVNKEKDVYMEKHCLGKLTENPYVIRLYSTFQDDENLYMLMQYIDGGELWQQIHNFGARAFPICLYYISEILKAINSIHKQGIVHRDIKSENILLTQDKKIKFIDFGLARDMNDLTIEDRRKWKWQNRQINWECYFIIQFLESIHLMEKVIIQCFSKHQQDYQTIFNGLSEIDKFTFDFALELNNAEDKICVKYEVNKVIGKYEKLIQDENYQKRLNYMNQIIEQNLQNRKDDDEEPQQFG